MNPEADTIEPSARDIEKCRAADIGLPQFGECLCKGPNSCAYALPFGYAFLCRHPRLREIVNNTKAEAEAA